MQEPWVNEFMQSTGFGNKLSVPQSAPSSTGVREQRFIQQYGESIPPPPAALGIPGTIEGQGAYLTGQMPVSKSLSTTQFEAPYPKSNILLNKDGTKSIQPTQQRKWQSPGIGDPQISNDLGNYPASEFIPGSKATGGFRVKESQGAAKEKNEGLKYGSIAGAVVAILAGAGVTMNRDNPTREKSFWGVLVVGTIAAITLLVLYLRSGEDGTKAPENLVGYRENGRKLLQKTGFSPPYYPQQRDQPDPEIYPNAPEQMDTFGKRMQEQGTNSDKLEGPRANVGYYRGAPTPDGRRTLPSNQLMRSPGNQNMDEGTYDEYMRRLQGESIPQVVQSNPYYTFNAEWDHRPQIDDSSRFHGIADEPGQMHRKSIYRDPKLQQAGAKRMHLKDPPPGSVMPLSKTHPWMEKDESGTGPAFFASPGEKLTAEMGGAHVQDMLHPRKNTPEIEILEDTSTAESNAASMMKERLALDERNEHAPKADPEFLKPQEVMSDRKRRQMMKQYQQPLEREEIEPFKQSPPETIKLDKGRIMPKQMDIHGSPEENQPVNQEQPTRAEDAEDMFLSAFLEKTTPDQAVIEKEMQSRRE